MIPNSLYPGAPTLSGAFLPRRTALGPGAAPPKELPYSGERRQYKDAAADLVADVFRDRLSHVAERPVTCLPGVNVREQAYHIRERLGLRPKIVHVIERDVRIYTPLFDAMGRLLEDLMEAEVRVYPQELKTALPAIVDAGCDPGNILADVCSLQRTYDAAISYVVENLPGPRYIETTSPYAQRNPNLDWIGTLDQYTEWVSSLPGRKDVATTTYRASGTGRVAMRHTGILIGEPDGDSPRFYRDVRQFLDLEPATIPPTP